jgi:hypothetical protein
MNLVSPTVRRARTVCLGHGRGHRAQVVDLAAVVHDVEDSRPLGDTGR